MVRLRTPKRSALQCALLQRSKQNSCNNPSAFLVTDRAVSGLGYVGLPFRRLQLINPEPLALGRRLNGVIFEIEMSSNWHANLLYDQTNLPVLELSKVDAAPPKWRVFPLRRGA